MKIILVLISLAYSQVPSIGPWQQAYISPRGCVTNNTAQQRLAPNGSAAEWNAFQTWGASNNVVVTNCVCNYGAVTEGAGYQVIYPNVPWIADPGNTYCVADRNGNTGFTDSGYCGRHQNFYGWNSCDVYGPGGWCAAFCDTTYMGTIDCAGNAVKTYNGGWWGGPFSCP